MAKHTIEERERVKSIFTFLKGMAELKMTSVLDIDKQLWKKYMAQIPQDDEYVHVSYRDTLKAVAGTADVTADEDAAEDDWILTVRKPELSACPAPDDILRPWLLPGWDRYDEKVRHHTERPRQKRGDAEVSLWEEREIFEENASRVKVYRAWLKKRELWVEEYVRLSQIRELFLELRRVSKELEQDSETKELVVGNGILTDNNDLSIRHPILLKRVRMTFDARRNEVAIRDTEAESELYTTVLAASENVHHNAVPNVLQALVQNDFHPLDRTDGGDFLRGAVRTLSDKGLFLKRNQTPPPNTKERLFLQDNPVFFMRRRVDGLAKFVDGVLDHIDATGYAPQPLWAIAGLHEKRTMEERPAQTAEQRLAALGGEDPEILLAMPANREQLAIAQQIERYDAVIVQGPPGTGKTHTIVNLMGHFLAQGKRILVTSHTKKALSVLREKMPEKMQSLCISLLDETNHDMERSVDGISSYMSCHDSRDVRQEKEKLRAERTKIIHELADVRKRIYQIECWEQENFVYAGESVSPAKAAKFVQEFEPLYATVIPGKVATGRGLPLSLEELYALYRSNGLLAADEERELALDVPNPETLIAPEELLSLRAQKRALEEQLRTMAEELDGTLIRNRIGVFLMRERHHIPLVRAEKSSIAALQQYLDAFETLAPWHIQAAADGRRGGAYRERWTRLCTQIEETAASAEQFVRVSFGKQVTISNDANRTEMQRVLPKMEEIYRQNGKIGFFKRLFDKSFDRVEGWTRINGARIGSAADCALVRSALSLAEQRAACGRGWDELLAGHGVTAFAELDAAEPERVAQTALSSIFRYLDWYDGDYRTLTKLMQCAALDAESVFLRKEMISETEYMKQILSCVHEFLPLFCNLLDVYGRYCATDDALRVVDRSIEDLRRCKSTLVSDLVRAFFGEDEEGYADVFRNITILHGKTSIYTAREDALQKLQVVAPGWADAIRARRGIHGASEVPTDIEEAWRWKQYDAMLGELTKFSPAEYRRQNTELGRDYRTTTEEAAVCSAWEYMLRRSERDGSVQQNLQSWRITMQALGTGKGKHAPTLRAQARELMGLCQRAVPAWIMTIRTALLQLDPREHHFDVVIVDEASQADLSALTMLYLGTKIIIVGDDKQVSPLAVGEKQSEVNKLIKMTLVGRIPAPHYYTGRLSLYDLGKTVCHPLMLREHFRCVPDIIGFSNMLCYDGNIKPLRDRTDSTLLPALVPQRIEGTRDGKKKINRAEAKHTVALIRAMTEMDAYRDKTIGVISLLGNEQSTLVMELLLRSSVDMEHHAILCGDAAQFQGDERDVIILNMVDSAEEDGMLRLTRDTKIVQRYNVAVSRARDQLWILHSFPASALKGDDIRSKLLCYAADPQAAAHALPQIRQMAGSPFEEAVAKTLVEHGYDIVQQWPVGHYRIDIVVRDGAKKIALECDGDRWHSGAEKVYEDMERQMILERLGWQFIRLRGSTYYRNPGKAMQGVMRELEAHDIHPATPADTVVRSDLVEEVRRRAEIYLSKKE